jgi:putative DNA primase/helicase
MTEKETDPREEVCRQPNEIEDSKNSPTYPREAKQNYNGHGKDGSWHEEAEGRPRWTHDTTLVAEFEYRRLDGSHAFYISKGIRPDGEKVFKTWRLNCIRFGNRLEPEEKVDHFPGLGDEPKVLFRLPELVAATYSGATVLIMEGEKDVETARELGLTATCNPFGALKWSDEYSPFLGGCDVIVCEDNDAIGRRHAAQVAASLQPYAQSVRSLALPNLPEHGDFSDWVDNQRKAGLTDTDISKRLMGLIEVAPKAPKNEAPDKRELNIVCLADVRTKQIQWLWPGRIAKGKVTALAGHPGIGKSMAGIDISARITKGARWPCGEGIAPKGSVIILTTEDDAADTIKPRILAAGGDVAKVYHIDGVREADGRHRTFSLSDDLELLEQKAKEIGDVVMIQIDPVNAYMPKASNFDSYKDTDIRSLFEPIQAMAARLNIAIWVVTHFNKTGGDKAMMRFLGSVGMLALARAAYAIVEDTDACDRRLMLPVKNNLGTIKNGFAYHVHEKPTGDETVPYCYAVEWENDHVTMSADEAMAPCKRDGRKSEDAERAKIIIREELTNGQAPAKPIEDKLRNMGIGDKSIRTAKKALGVKSIRAKNAWLWHLPSSSGENDPF